MTVVAEAVTNSASSLIRESETNLTHNNTAAVTVEPVRLNEFIAQELSIIPEVSCVYTLSRNSVLYVWVVVTEYKRAVREKIYGIEQQIIAEFPDPEFDFYIVDKPDGCDEHEMISEAELAYRKPS